MLGGAESAISLRRSTDGLRLCFSIDQLETFGTGVLGDQGKLAEAQAAFEESFSMGRRLPEGDPSNLNCQRDLSLAFFADVCSYP